MSSPPKIVLYTSHSCPWAHRAQITLKELNLEFETVIIDLAVPRSAEYLKINPRGLVPALSYNGQILTESGIVSQFLSDSHPSHLEKTSSEPGGALQRAKINFFVDTYFSKASSLYIPLLRAQQGAEKEELAGKFVDAIVKEVEGLFDWDDGKGPFFGGSEKFTLAEVLTAPFVLRLLTFAKHEELVPGSLLKDLEAKAPKYFKWANTVIKQNSVIYIWDEKTNVEKAIARFAAAK